MQQNKIDRHHMDLGALLAARASVLAVINGARHARRVGVAYGLFSALMTMALFGCTTIVIVQPGPDAAAPDDAGMQVDAFIPTDGPVADAYLGPDGALPGDDAWSATDGAVVTDDAWVPEACHAGERQDVVTGRCFSVGRYDAVTLTYTECSTLGADDAWWRTPEEQARIQALLPALGAGDVATALYRSSPGGLWTWYRHATEPVDVTWAAPPATDTLYAGLRSSGLYANRFGAPQDRLCVREP